MNFVKKAWQETVQFVKHNGNNLRSFHRVCKPGKEEPKAMKTWTWTMYLPRMAMGVCSSITNQVMQFGCWVFDYIWEMGVKLVAKLYKKTHEVEVLA